MTIRLVDTSVAVPYVLASHRAHGLVTKALAKGDLVLAGHAAIETYSVLTRLPGDARLSATDARRLIESNFAGVAHPATNVLQLLDAMVTAEIAGGATYDGLVALAAQNSPSSTLYSRDARAAATYARLGVNFKLI